MKGGIIRYIPDPQSGSGFTKDVLKGLKSVTSVYGPRNLAMDYISGGVPRVKRNVKRGVKRKALDVINREAKKKLDDIFGE